MTEGQTTTIEAPGEEQQDSPLEVLRPSAEPKIRRIGVGDEAREYVQRPMGFFQKMRMYEILGDAIDQIASGEGGGVLRSVFGAQIQSGGDLADAGRTAMLADADTFLRLVGRLAGTAPDLLLDLYILFLAVPPAEQPWARLTMQRSVEEGGLSDDEGIDVLVTAIDQNGEAIRDFFVDKVKVLNQRIAAMFPAARAGGDSASSKPSRATQRTTRKQ